MKLWMRRILVVLIAVMTLGLYIPEFDADVEAEQSKETADSDLSSKMSANESDGPQTLTVDPPETHPEPPTVDPMLVLSEKATEQALMKMGPRIANKVEDEFREDILPKMEEALHMILHDTGVDDLNDLSITERPSAGFGERIFHVYDERTGNAVARFDVRRENRPAEGYWFNFHYHVSSDGFRDHHDIGDIYWDRNTPPRWMA